MNYIQVLSEFFDRVSNDHRLNPTHISLYVSLFNYWNRNGFRSPITVTRGDLMLVSKISSKGTYHKCMRELHNYGYLRYAPSYNPFRGSWVYMFSVLTKVENLSENRNGIEEVMNKHKAGLRQVVGPSINRSNRSNRSNDHDPDRGTSSKFVPVDKEIPACLADVLALCDKLQHPKDEGEKFFNHYQTNGWLIAGKYPMRDWQAAFVSWMSKCEHFDKKGGSLKNEQAEKPKNYGEPL